MKKRIHINQHVIRANKKNGTNDPAITVKTYNRQLYATASRSTGRRPLFIHQTSRFHAARVYGWKLTTGNGDYTGDDIQAVVA